MENPLAQEEARIKTVYAKRQGSELYTLFNPGALSMVQEVERALLDRLRRYGLSQLGSCEILEIGCGTGYWLREFIKWGATPEHVHGIDLLPARVARARQLSPSAVQISCGSAAELAFPDSTFDIVLQATVFTSILDPNMKRRIAAEMLRVVKPQGLILWYDYHVNNPRNPDVRGVSKTEITRLFPGCTIHLRRLTLLPPLTRRLARYSWLMCALLSQLPWLCTHYVGVIRK